MILLDLLRDYMANLSARRRYRRNEMMIAALPMEIRKDIGWPGSARGVRRAASRGLDNETF